MGLGGNLQGGRDQKNNRSMVVDGTVAEVLKKVTEVVLTFVQKE